MRNKFVVGFLTGLLLLGTVGIASATTIAIGNASFENDFVADRSRDSAKIEWDNTMSIGVVFMKPAQKIQVTGTLPEITPHQEGIEW